MGCQDTISSPAWRVQPILDVLLLGGTWNRRSVHQCILDLFLCVPWSFPTFCVGKTLKNKCTNVIFQPKPFIAEFQERAAFSCMTVVCGMDAFCSFLGVCLDSGRERMDSGRGRMNSFELKSSSGTAPSPYGNIQFKGFSPSVCLQLVQTPVCE